MQARIFDVARGGVVLDAARVANATDIEFHRPRADEGALLVVACEPGQDFLRFRLEAGGVSEAAPLTATRTPAHTCARVEIRSHPYR